jgi:sodium/hydrogen exchanger 10/11
MGTRLPLWLLAALALLLAEATADHNNSHSSLYNISAHDKHHGEHHSEHHPTDHLVLLCLFSIVVLGAAVKHLFSSLPIPYTVILSMFGVILAAVCKNPTDDFQEAVIRFSNIDAHLILYVFLPPLLFESAFNMDVTIFSKVFKQVLLLAGPGLMVATFITGYLSWLVIGDEWRFVDALLFGAIASATDPVAVVALLNDLGAPKQLGHMIEGESLLNDGTAIVIYSVIIEVVQDSHYLEAQGPHGIIWVFLRMAVGGVLLGFMLSSISIMWIRRVFNDPMTEISITLAFTYLTFFIAEHVCGFSGVMAVVTFGLHLNKNRLAISPEVAHFLHEFWTMIGYLANTVIFVLIGLILFLQNSEALSSPVKWGNLMLIYLVVTLARVVCFAMFYPLLKTMGFGFTWQEGVVAVWGGLRGAVGLALALGSKHAFADSPLVYKDLLFYVSGIVLLTLVVNGTSMKQVRELRQGLPFASSAPNHSYPSLPPHPTTLTLRFLRTQPLLPFASSAPNHSYILILLFFLSSSSVSGGGYGRSRRCRARGISRPPLRLQQPYVGR